MLIKQTLAVWFIGSFLFSSGALAFPEMVRLGYINCVACHVSPTGGGVLVPYGRQISKEVLPTWQRDGEEKFFYIVNPPQWLNLGGDLRLFELKQINPDQSTVTTYIPMQEDVEAAATVGKFTFDAAFGYRNDVSPPDSGNWFSRRHYIMYKPTNEVSFRAGRFYPAFGLNIAEHNTVIRQGLGWDQGQETYNIEFALLKERFNLYGTAIFGRPDNPDLYVEQGGAASVAFLPADTMQVGLGYYYGGNILSSHHFFGPWGILGFTPHFFLLSQITGVRSMTPTYVNPELGFVDYNRLDYEIFQGFHVFGTQEYSQTDYTNNATRLDRYGLGIQFFPRPHYEFQVIWQSQFMAQSSPPTDYWEFYFHFYP